MTLSYYECFVFILGQTLRQTIPVYRRYWLWPLKGKIMNAAWFHLIFAIFVCNFFLWMDCLQTYAKLPWFTFELNNDNPKFKFAKWRSYGYIVHNSIIYRKCKPINIVWIYINTCFCSVNTEYHMKFYL
jgi:hypothetical protein